MLWNEYPSTADYSYVNPEQAIGGHQETNPDVWVAGPVSTPPSTGTEVFKPCQPLLLSSSNRSCTQVVTFLHGRRSLCSGTTPEGKAEVDYQSGERVRNLQNKLGSEPCACSLWEWFSWFLLCLSEGLFVLFDSGLDSLAGGRWFIQLWMLAWVACVVVWACMTTSLWALVTQRMDARKVIESGNCQCCIELGRALVLKSTITHFIRM